MLIGTENHFYVCRFCAARENLTHAAEVRLYAAKKQNTAIESARGTSPWTARQPAGKGKVPKLEAGYRQTMVFFHDLFMDRHKEVFILEICFHSSRVFAVKAERKEERLRLFDTFFVCA